MAIASASVKEDNVRLKTQCTKPKTGIRKSQVANHKSPMAQSWCVTTDEPAKDPPQRGVNARGGTRFYSVHSGYCLCEYLVWSTRSQYASYVEEHREGLGSVASDSKIEIKRSEFSGLPGQVGRDAARVGRTRNPDLRGTIPGR